MSKERGGHNANLGIFETRDELVAEVERMRSNGLFIRQIARKCKVSRSTVQRIIKGDKPEIKNARGKEPPAQASYLDYFWLIPEIPEDETQDETATGTGGI